MTSTLRIGDRIVLRAEGGAPEAEFALFDAGDIELLATDPGIVREVGYRTTAGEAGRRLDVAGVTVSLTLETAAAMRAGLALAYARGQYVRRAAGRFGAAEMFESNAYDAEQHRYEGTWLDLPRLAEALAVPRGTALLQAIFLRARLAEVPEETEVVLDTRDIASHLRPGQRSYKRMSFEHLGDVPTAIHAMTDRAKRTPPELREEGPTKSVLLESLRARIDVTSDATAHERFTVIEAALAARERPARGPLADPEIWALEEQMSMGDTTGVLEQLDALDKRRGRDPATAYLRARAQLLAGREAPSAIAEKASAMAMAMSSFPELELLAAEAWAAAGQMKRAAPFARDLIDNPGTDDDLRARAVQLLSQARVSGAGSVPPSPGAAGLKKTPIPPRPASRPPSRPPSLIPHDSERAMISVAPPPGDIPNLNLPRASVRPPPVPTDLGNEDETVSRRLSSTARAVLEQARRASSRPPEASIGKPPTGPSSFQPLPPQPSRAPNPPVGRGTARPPAGSVAPVVSERPPTVAPVEMRRSLMPQPQRSPELMRGASQPPFRADSPAAHMHIPKAPPAPRGGEAELASDLSLPPGLLGHAGMADVIPTSVVEARIHFTFLVRQLGAIFRDQYDTPLFVDASGIEAIQARMLEDYPDGMVQTVEQGLEVRRYGAFLSEVMARSFGAFWVDIAPADLGYWAMVVPPDTRVWPFGRVLRFIALAHRERDLVSYYLELLARAERS